MEENLKEKLFNTRENGWDTVDTRKKEAIFSFTKSSFHWRDNVFCGVATIVSSTSLSSSFFKNM